MSDIATKVLEAGFTGEEARELTKQLQAAEDPMAVINQIRADLDFDLAELKDYVRVWGDDPGQGDQHAPK